MGAKNTGGFSWKIFNKGGILKRDRLVSGLLQINAVHQPHRWTDDTVAIHIQFERVLPGVYAPPGLSPTEGYYIKIYTSSSTATLFWFNSIPGITGVPTGSPATDDVVETIEVSFVGLVGLPNTEDAAAQRFETAFLTSANLEDKFTIYRGGTTEGGEEQTDHRIMIRGTQVPGATTPGAISTVDGSYYPDAEPNWYFAQQGGYGAVPEDIITTEPDFKQAMFNNTLQGLSGGGVYTNMSPYMSNEKAPWEGEIYDGRSGLSTQHQTQGRYKHDAIIEDQFFFHNASLGDHCTYLYFLTAATRIQDLPRTWGKKIVNEGFVQLLSSATGSENYGDFDKEVDVTTGTFITQGGTSALGKTWLEDGPSTPGMSPSPDGTGSMRVEMGVAHASDMSNDYGTYSVYQTSLSVTSGDRLNLTWDIDSELSGSFLSSPGTGRCGLTVKVGNLWSGATIAPFSGTSFGGVIGGPTIAKTGTALIIIPPGCTRVSVWVSVLPSSGTAAGGDVNWPQGAFEVNYLKLYDITGNTQYSDLLNVKNGTPLSNTWYTERPDDGLSYMWVRSHLLSVQNNSEPYDEEFKIKSHRVTFTASSSAAQEAGVISIGKTMTSVGGYTPLGSDVVDNYNYRQWKNYKPGDLIRVSGADDPANNGLFQLRWDWDYNSEYYYGYTDGDNPTDGDPFPNMQFRCMPIRMEDNGLVTGSHSFVNTEFKGQLFTEDITITSTGSYTSEFTDAEVPLEFSHGDGIEGFAIMDGNVSPSILRVEITKPGLLTLADATALVITVSTTDGTPLTIVSCQAAGTGFTQFTVSSDHDLVQNQAVHIQASAEPTYNGDWLVSAVDSATTFIIEVTFVTTEICQVYSLAPGTSTATFSHTAVNNMNISPVITIENVTRRYQDSSNSKGYDFSIPPTEVDNPPDGTPAGIDTHAVPLSGRYGNHGKVSKYNHGYDSYSEDFNGQFESGNRSEHFAELHEYEGRWGTHHKLETWHNPVAGTPEIYGKRDFNVNQEINVYDAKIVNSLGIVVDNDDFIPEFCNGKWGVTEGTGFVLYPSPVYGKVFNADNIDFGKPKILIQVPLKAYESPIEEGSSDTEDESLYDTHIEVMWQPFGETNQMKIEKSDDTHETEM